MGMVDEEFDMVLIKTNDNIIKYREFIFDINDMEKLIPITHCVEKKDIDPYKTKYLNFTFLRIR